MFYFYFFEFLLRFYHAHLIWPSLIVDNFLLFMNSRSILECFNSTVPNATLLLLSSILAPPFFNQTNQTLLLLYSQNVIWIYMYVYQTGFHQRNRITRKHTTRNLLWGFNLPQSWDLVKLSIWCCHICVRQSKTEEDAHEVREARTNWNLQIWAGTTDRL